MSVKTICPICEKRRAERYCPAKGEKICAIDCGTGREVTIDCPSDCSYLIAAHRWEREHPIDLTESAVAFPEISVSSGLIHTRQNVLSGIGYTVVVYGKEQPSLMDMDVLEAVQSMVETYRTLTAGIYFEKPPGGMVAAGLYAALAKFFEDARKVESQRPDAPPLKDSEIFQLLVFFLRFGRLQSNGRPKTRGFIDFLRSQFPREIAQQQEEPRIIMP